MPGLESPAAKNDRKRPSIALLSSIELRDDRKSMNTQANRSRPRITWLLAAVVLPVGYVLSCGPVLATAFWLREATSREGFYAALWLYYPLLAFGPSTPIDAYIGWWCKLFGTVGPG
jgi:hypothetical protein